MNSGASAVDEVSKNGLLHIAVTGLGRETMLSQIIKLVEQAQGEKVPILEFGDRLATYLVPLVLVLAASVFAGWAIFDHSPDRWMQAVSHMVAVLVISCPCALTLAPGTALMVAAGSFSQYGSKLDAGGGQLPAAQT